MRSRCSCNPPPKQMLFPVLKRKGKVPWLNSPPPRSTSWLRGEGLRSGRGPCPGALVQHPVWVFPPVPRPAEEAALSWRHPQGQVPRPCAAIIAEGARHPGPGWPSSFSFKVERIGASLVAQWLRVCLPMQGTRVRALVWEDPTCRGATRPVSHNY